ncbi:MAG: hypothetical protein FWC73_05810 [Defluviitaleaceae bacterium]|nr:hypothetical protein [Defluviitaleaceae bacterium]
MKQKLAGRRTPKCQVARVFLLFAVLVVAVAFVVIIADYTAHYEDYIIDYQYLPAQEYLDDYSEYNPGYEQYNNIQNEYDAYNGGYIGYAPEYTGASSDNTHLYIENTPTYMGQISITVGEDYSTDVWPSHVEYEANVVICYDVTVQLELMWVDYAATIDVNLPYGWTYTINHGVANRVMPIEICPDGDIINETVIAIPYANIQIIPEILPTPVGFRPFIFGADWVVDVFSNPVGFNGLFQAIADAPTNALPGNDFIIAVNADIDMTQNIVINGARRIILASYGTNLATNTGGIRRTLTNETTARHFTVSAGSTLTLSNIILCGVDRYSEGGGITVTGLGSNLVLEHNTIIQENRVFGATSGGGAGITVENSAVFTMNGGLIRYGRTTGTNHAGGVGIRGGTAANNSRFIMNGGEISHNIAMGGTGVYHGTGPHVGSGIGGGVTVNGANARFDMWGGYILHNLSSSRMSGGVDIRGGGRFYMHYGTIAYNVSSSIFVGGTGGGGGVAVLNNDSVFTMNGGYIRNNIAWGQGGGIRIRQGTVNMHGGVVHNNFAGWRGGGGVANTRVGTENMPTFNFYGGIIRDNRAANVNRHLHPTPIEPTIFPHGGGVQVDTGHFNVRGADPKFIIDNHTTHNGGGINWAVGTMTIDPAVTTLHVTGNSAGINGGGIYLGGHGFLMREGFYVNDNSARQFGGGIFLRGGNFNMTGGEVNNNGQLADGIFTAANNVDYVWAPNSVETQRGGGVHVSGGNFIMANGSIEDNNSLISGGGVYLTGGGFTMHMGDINGNTTQGTALAQGGGGVFVTGGNFTMVGPAVKNINNNTALNGGGIYVAGGDFTIGPGGNVNNNNTPITGTSRGVGVFMGGGTVHMTGGNINGNTANTTPSYGGGVHLAGGTFNLSNGNIGGLATAGNSATDGGGVYIYNGTLSMTGGSIQNNEASRHGGGVHISGTTSTFTMNGGIVGDTSQTNGNTAQHGGGVWLGSGAHFNMQSGTIRYNTALTGAIIPSSQGTGGGVYLTGSGTIFNMTGGTIRDNVAQATQPGRGGGGVDVRNSAVFNMCQQNPPTGTLTPILIYRNYSHNTGGGVNINNAVTNMWRGTISYNSTENTTVLGNGGGVSVSGRDGYFILNNGNITNNVGRIGGGIFLYRANAIMYGGVISGNASRNQPGGGVGIYSAENAGYGLINAQSTFTMHGGIIENNGSQTHPRNGTLDQTTYGGGVALGRGFAFVNMYGGIIRNNQATNGGGGAAIIFSAPFVGGSQFTMNPSSASTHATADPVIYGNTAPRGGGAFVVGAEPRSTSPIQGQQSTFVMNGGTIGGDPTLLANGNPIKPNTALCGGGVYVNSGGLFSMPSTSTGRVQGNIATGTSPGYGGGGIFIGPLTTPGIGGGANVNTSEANLGSGSQIIDNTALTPGSGTVDGGGGGIYVTQNSRLNATGTHILRNSAPYGMGGGIFTEWHEYDEPLTFVPPAFTGNNVTYSNLTLSNVTFNNNSASSLHWSPSNATSAIPATAFATTSQPAIVVAPHRHPLNNYDINYHFVGSERFEFIKTDQQLYSTPPVINPVEGAQFILFRTNVPTVQATLGTGSDGLVTINPSTNLPNTPWVAVQFATGNYVATSTTSSYIAFDMDPRFTYQLVELVPPLVFQAPLGQWRVTYNMVAAAGVNPFEVVSIGGQFMPLAINSLAPQLNATTHPNLPRRHSLWYIGNMLQFELPMSGGSGAMVFVIAGGVSIAIALIAMVGIMVKGKKYSTLLRIFNKK